MTSGFQLLVTGGKEVVVSRKAGEAVLRGAQPYVPGCIAASAGLEAGDLVAVSSPCQTSRRIVACPSRSGWRQALLPARKCAGMQAAECGTEKSVVVSYTKVVFSQTFHD
jgi:hypothetical protein